ncbi:L-lysine 6-transaminase [Rhodococcus sp. YH3-3]|uniref:L-lysine 6-transaminase n=1 Tax=Rhodococcus sp. YH3-3 TaxID=1803579 RepID=UPI0007DB15D1|nr:L-lysine 6-transaminase [Rhodococcus sp. YH3-3]
MSTAMRDFGDSALFPVYDVLKASILVDGFDLILDVEGSRGSYLRDLRDGTEYLDMFGFFGSSALGMNHPAIAGDEEFQQELAVVASNKPSNSDIYTEPMARFVAAFARVLGDSALPHLFFVDGGALAVENALKVAFDWKSRWNESRGLSADLGTKVLHLTEAFHGRSGYTMSLTNTEPGKVARFPKFDWPRIDSPYLADGRDVEAAERQALDQARRDFADNPDDIACFIAEPIQGEGGDHHLRPEFLQAMQELCHENDALFILDEVQTGCGITGTAWAYQQLGLSPDVVAFGKKTQVCGIMAGGRVDEVHDNVFHVSSRINSTWGGNLTDMVRARRILEVVEQDRLIDRVRFTGAHLLARLTEVCGRYAAATEPRGRGLMCAITLEDSDLRDRVVQRLREDEHVMILPTGKRGIRFRPALTVTTSELDDAVDAVERVLARET